MTVSTHLPLRQRIERRLVGWAMSFMAWLLEKTVLGSLKKK